MSSEHGAASSTPYREARIPRAACIGRTVDDVTVTKEPCPRLRWTNLCRAQGDVSVATVSGVRLTSMIRFRGIDVRASVSPLSSGELSIEQSRDWVFYTPAVQG